MSKRAATKPADWPRGPVEIGLPSGAFVRAYRPNLFTWQKTGQIPDEVWACIVASARDEEIELADKVAAINWIICKCVAEPEITIVPREGCLCVDEIDDLDREYLMTMLGIGLG